MASGETKKTAKADNVQPSVSGPARSATAALPPARRNIRLDRIIVADRLREIDHAAVDMLAVSMAEGGLNAPVLVRPLRTDGDDMVFGLVTGGHRYAAAQRLGWSEIECSIRNLTDDQARMAEIDENLIRRGLTPLDRAVFVNERLQVWAKLHPDRVTEDEDGEVRPKRGRPAKSTKFVEFLGDTPPMMGFSTETAVDLGLSEMTIKSALVIARGLSVDTRAKVAGTKVAKNEGLLRQLAAVPDKGEQLRAAEALVSEQAKTFPDALVIATGKTPAPAPAPRPVDETVAALAAIWKKAPPTHLDAFLHWASGQRLPPGWVITKGGADA